MYILGRAWTLQSSLFRTRKHASDWRSRSFRSTAYAFISLQDLYMHVYLIETLYRLQAFHSISPIHGIRRSSHRLLGFLNFMALLSSKLTALGQNAVFHRAGRSSLDLKAQNGQNKTPRPIGPPQNHRSRLRFSPPIV